MLWVVTGAMRDTGADVAIEVEADDEQAAGRRAARRGVLVSSVVAVASPDEVEPAVDDTGDPVPGDAFDYGRPVAPVPTSAARPRSVIPHYPAIVKGAKALNVLALVASVMGWTTIALSLIAALAAIQGASNASANLILAELVPAVGGLIAGVGQLIVAALLRMAGSVGLAVRDLARNSFAK